MFWQRLVVVAAVAALSGCLGSLGQPVLTLGLGEVTAVAFSPDGRYLAAGGTAASVKLIDVATWELVRGLEGHTGRVTALAFDPEGRFLASASYDGTVILWEVETGQRTRTFAEDAGEVESVAFSPDGRVLATGYWDATISLWDVATGALLRNLRGHRGAVTSLSFSPTQPILASASYDHTVGLWSSDSGMSLGYLTAGKSRFVWVQFSHDGRMLAAAGDAVVFWDAETRSVLQTLDTRANAACLSSYSDLLATTSRYDKTSLWGVEIGERLPVLPEDLQGADCIALSPGPPILLACGYSDGSIVVLRAVFGDVVKTIRGPGRAGWVGFSPDGKQLLICSSLGGTTFWDPVTGALLRSLPKVRASLAALSPDGRILATDGSYAYRVQLWDALTGEELAKLEGHGSRITSLAFSPDGRFLASASDNGAVKLWDVATYELVGTKTLPDVSGSLGYSEFWDSVKIDFSPDGKALASTGGGAVVYLLPTLLLLDSPPEGGAEGSSQVAPSESSQVPCAMKDQLIVGSYNALNFGWGENYCKELDQLASVIAGADLVALQEVMQLSEGGKACYGCAEDLCQVEKLVEALTTKTQVAWEYLASPPMTFGSRTEYYVILYRRDKVAPTGVVGTGNDLGAEFQVRSPFFAGFRSGEFDFIVVDYHAPSEDSSVLPLTEVAKLASVLDSLRRLEEDVIVLGDFNVDRSGLDDRLHRLVVEATVTVEDTDRYFDTIFIDSRSTDRDFAGRAGVTWDYPGWLVSDHSYVWAAFYTCLPDDD